MKTKIHLILLLVLISIQISACNAPAHKKRIDNEKEITGLIVGKHGVQDTTGSRKVTGSEQETDSQSRSSVQVISSMSFGAGDKYDASSITMESRSPLKDEQQQVYRYDIRTDDGASVFVHSHDSGFSVDDCVRASTDKNGLSKLRRSESDCGRAGDGPKIFGTVQQSAD